jgi:predicted ArsR family transcriptional regulator
MAEPTYPNDPGHKGPSETGRDAATAYAPRAKPIRERALEIIERGPSTPEQIAAEIGQHFMIVRARCSELRAQGLVEDSGRRGSGALGGRVIVWRRTTVEERALFNARKAAQAEKTTGDA